MTEAIVPLLGTSLIGAVSGMLLALAMDQPLRRGARWGTLSGLLTGLAALLVVK